MLRFLKRLRSSGTSRPKSQARSSRPAVEHLEGRQLLSTFGVGTITYQDTFAKQHLYAFERRADGHLHVNYGDGSTWHWADQGKPATASITDSPATATFVDGGGNQRLYAFARGSDGHLYVNYWNGAWHWLDQGKPAAASVVGTPNVVAYADSAENERLYVFARGSDGHLYVNYWNGAWHWADQGKPTTAPITGDPGAVTYVGSSAERRIYAFARGSDGHLYVDYYNGSGWHWADQGKPAAATVVSTPSVVTYVGSSGAQLIYAFERGSDGHLYVNYWNGAWHWADQGKPAAATVAGDPSVITFVDALGLQRIYAFERGSDGHLYDNYWNGAWHWADQGKPAAATVTGDPGVLTYVDGLGHQRIYSFAHGSNDHLYVDYYNGSGWQWADQGS
jgi:hypothetical protein